MNDQVSPVAYRYALFFYTFFAAYFWYVFYSLFFFLSKNYFSQTVTSVFSIQNSNFNSLNVSLTSLATFIVVLILFLNKNLKEFVVDVGDELSRISWPELSDTQKKGMMVIGLVIICAIFLFLFDVFFIKVINIILNLAA